MGSTAHPAGGPEAAAGTAHNTAGATTATAVATTNQVRRPSITTPPRVRRP
ncbi:MAG TPA: hypothetical protein VFP54_11040 [Acidimicrobiales bacterium]|nr:hypothetical protein [Acidimicrobiales bacterium]